MDASLTAESILVDCLAQALPVSTLPRLLNTLASTWSNLTGSDVCVTAIDVQSAQQFAALVVDGQVTEFHDPTQQAQWRPAAIEQWLHGMLEVRGVSIERTIPFDSLGDAIGGVCILGDSEPSEFEQPAIDVSSRLLGQWKEAFELRQQLAGRLPDDARLEAMAEFAAGAGHEINNPLGTISGRVQMLLPGEMDPDRRLSLETIGAQTLRIRDMIGDAMLFARPPKPAIETVPLTEIANEVVEALSNAAVVSGHRLTIESSDRCEAEADPIQFKVVLGALIYNSIEATNSGGIVVSMNDGEDDQAGYVVMRVADSGSGLSADEVEHMFDPFYSGRQAGRGLGFGLSKCWRIVTNHGGKIAVDCTAGGTVFTVLWPTANRES